jgi:ComF family protein
MPFTQPLLSGALQVVRWLNPPVCLLCHETHTGVRPICVACQDTLPRNPEACRKCALPLPTTSRQHTPRQFSSGSLIKTDAFFTRQKTRSSPSQQMVCDPCRHTPPIMTETLAPFLMRGAIRDLIHIWKFRYHPHLTPLLATLFAEASFHLAPRAANSPGILVPIPTHWDRMLHRGFDHTWLLAQALNQHIPCSPGVKSWLKNRERRVAQHRLSRAERLSNASACFRASPKMAGSAVIVVDDVITTGATASAAAQACIDAGARSVKVWCVARTPAPGLSR